MRELIPTCDKRNPGRVARCCIMAILSVLDSHLTFWTHFFCYLHSTALLVPVDYL